MSRRIVLNVADAAYRPAADRANEPPLRDRRPRPHAVQQTRLKNAMEALGETCMFWSSVPADWPAHEDIPFAFKACALDVADMKGYDCALWVDADLVPTQRLDCLWGQIERVGWWLPGTEFNNAQWTADSAYHILFPELGPWKSANDEDALARSRRVNATVPHLSTSAFGLSMRYNNARKFLDDYCRLATETRAFCGPKINAPRPPRGPFKTDYAPCGPFPEVKGHHHDATAASVIAWGLGIKPNGKIEDFFRRES